MSDFATKQMEAAKADVARYAFLSKALASWADENGLEFGEWDKRFLSSYSYAERQSCWLTQGRREAVDRMMRKYSVDLGLEFVQPATVKATIPPADPGCCMFYVRDPDAGGQLRHCNDQAAVSNRLGFLYCKAHEEAVQRDLRRRKGKTMIVFPYQPK